MREQKIHAPWGNKQSRSMLLEVDSHLLDVGLAGHVVGADKLNELLVRDRLYLDVWPSINCHQHLYCHVGILGEGRGQIIRQFLRIFSIQT